MLQNVAFYRVDRSISAALLRENKEATVAGSPQTVACAGTAFLLTFCSHNMDDHGGGQNTTIHGQMLGKKAKNHAKHIKQLYLSINRE